MDALILTDPRLSTERGEWSFRIGYGGVIDWATLAAPADAGLFTPPPVTKGQHVRLEHVSGIRYTL